MQRRFFTIFCLMIALVALAASTRPSPTQAQGAGGDCPQLVQQALDDVGNSCGGLGRNNACYGFNRVNATFSADLSDDIFAKPADKTSLKNLQTIQTAPLDEALKEWGVAVMSVQANIPDTLPGQAVSFILLGDVKVDNAVPADQSVAPADPPLDITAQNQSNIRTLPTTNSNVIGSVEPGTVLKADATNATKDWLRVVFDDKTPGWISRGLVKADSALDNLPVFATDSKTPMQAFYFKTGVGTPSCNKAPDALVVQGPDRVGVDITANGANVHIGSTVAFRTIEGNQMQIFTIHGQAKVNGVTIPIGFVTTVHLADDGKTVVGEPEKPRPITQDELDELQWLELIPTDVLNYPITVPDTQYVPPRPTAVPAGNNPSGSVAHPVTAVNCGPFKATSPLDGLNYGMNTFYWDAAPGATSYRINVQGAGSKEITAPITNANFDISGAGFNPQLSWSVDALYNGVAVCSTPTITIPRQWAPPPPATPVPGTVITGSIECGEFEFTFHYGNLPAGSTGVTLNYDVSSGEFFPGSPLNLPAPPNSGSVNVDAGAGAFTVSSISIVASPSGASVALPDTSCISQAG